MKAPIGDERQSTSGRPRDPAIDVAVLDATAELLVEVGYAGLTMAAIAQRAGTTKPAVYRRWTGKAQVVHEAVFREDASTELPRSESLEDDVRRMVTGTRDLFARPEVRAALPGLLAEVAADPALHRALVERLSAGVWGALADRIAAAVAAGEARPGVDADVLIQVVGGSSLLALTLHPTHELDDAWVDSVTSLILRGIRP